MSLTDLIPTLQLAVGPVILISGIGLILLSMTNRYGRLLDRARRLTGGLHRSSEAEHESLIAQLRVLSRRAVLVRASITSAAISILLAAILVISLFLGALLQLEIAAIIVGIFILCMLSLIISLLLFLSDINLSLKALWLEIPPEGRQ